MNLYQFALPLKTNDGSASYERQLLIWEELAIDEGGFTNLGDRSGAWRDDKTGVVYRETMRGYQFAGTVSAAYRLLDAAKALFPDQLAFYLASIGAAEIVDAAAIPAPKKSLPPLYNRRGVAMTKEEMTNG